MPSPVDICNLALGHLGDRGTVASIDPPEGSAQAAHCARFYPMARDALLEMHPWRFATRRKALALLEVGAWTWAFAYAEPSDLLRTVAVLPPDAIDDSAAQPYDIELADSGVRTILTNQEGAVLRYVARGVDSASFPPLFVDALAWLLASYLAGPILKGDVGKDEAKRCLAAFSTSFALATVSDASQRKSRQAHVPPWLAAR